MNGLKQWVDETQASHCFQCEAPFSFFLRKHHCRLCGRVFCWRCTDTKAPIPTFLRHEIPTSPDRPGAFFLASAEEGRKRRLCDRCHSRTVAVQKNGATLEALLVLAEKGWIGLNEWVCLRGVSIDFRAAVDELLKRVRRAKRHDAADCRVVRALRPCLLSHPGWWRTLKAVGTAKAPPRHCRLLGCACGPDHLVPVEDAVFVVLNLSHRKALYKEALRSLHHQLDALSPLLPVLCYAPLRSATFFDDFLRPLCEDNPAIAHRIAFTAKAIGNEPVFHRVCRIEPSVSHGLAFGDLLLKLSKEVTVEGRRRIVEERKGAEKYLIPGQVEYWVEEIRVGEIRTIESSTRPVLVPVVCRSTTTKKLCLITILVKNEPILTDFCVVHFLAHLSFLRPGWKDAVVTYHVQPLTLSSGIVVIVSKSKTLHQIKSSQQTIQNFLLLKNPTTASRALRSRFVRSCVVSSVLSYCTGLGDRHLCNLMLTENGCLFHIDFGFLFQNEPIHRKVLPRFNLKLTPEIVDMMGGSRNSPAFDAFVEETTRLFQDVRKSTKVFYYIFAPLFLCKNDELSKEDLERFIERKLVPNHTKNEATVLIEDLIRQSTVNTTTEIILDLAHFIKQTWL